MKLRSLVSIKSGNVAFHWGSLLHSRQAYIFPVTNILLTLIQYIHCKRTFRIKYFSISVGRHVSYTDGWSKSGLTIKICLEFVAKWLMDWAQCSINPPSPCLSVEQHWWQVINSHLYKVQELFKYHFIASIYIPSGWQNAKCLGSLSSRQTMGGQQYLSICTKGAYLNIIFVPNIRMGMLLIFW